MKQLIAVEIAKLKEMSLECLKEKFVELFGEPPSSSVTHQRIWRKIAYRMQELRYGGLSDEVHSFLKDEAEKLKSSAKHHDSKPKVKKSKRDRRIPLPGTVITRKYKNQLV